MAKVEPDLIVFGLTAASFVPERGGNAGIEAAMRTRTGIPGLAAGTCVVQAIRAVSMRRLAEVTPYARDVRELGRRCLGITPLPGGGHLMQQTGRGDARDQA